MSVRERKFSARDMTRYSDATYRQIDYWTRGGLAPSAKSGQGLVGEDGRHLLGNGSGKHRKYSVIDVLTARCIVNLSDLGARRSFMPVMQSVRDAIEVLTDERIESWLKDIENGRHYERMIVLWVTATGETVNVKRRGLGSLPPAPPNTRGYYVAYV